MIEIREELNDCNTGRIATAVRLEKNFPFFRFKMRAKFTVADESSRKFNVLYETVVLVTCCFQGHNLEECAEKFFRIVQYSGNFLTNLTNL